MAENNNWQMGSQTLVVWNSLVAFKFFRYGWNTWWCWFDYRIEWKTLEKWEEMKGHLFITVPAPPRNSGEMPNLKCRWIEWSRICKSKLNLVQREMKAYRLPEKVFQCHHKCRHSIKEQENLTKHKKSCQDQDEKCTWRGSKRNWAKHLAHHCKKNDIVLRRKAAK